jgi:hypothetical protein
MNKAVHFQSAIVAALADRSAARDEIFAWLRNLTPEERAKVPPEKFTRLTSEQFAILLGRATPHLRWPLPRQIPRLNLSRMLQATGVKGQDFTPMALEP